MASRSRPRTSQAKDDADEERSIWNSLLAEAKDGDDLLNTLNDNNKRIYDLATEQQNTLASGGIPSAKIEEELENLIRSNLPTVEKLRGIVEGDNDSQNLSLTRGLELLSALRASSESEPAPRSASTTGAGKGQRNLKRKHEQPSASSIAGVSVTGDDRESIAADSPGGPSPKVASAARLMGKASSRSGSVPAGREASVKAEDSEAAEGLKALPPDRNKLQIGIEVFYRNKAKAVEGEGILCSITNIYGEGKQRRYEIRDSDPDPPTPPLPYRASVNHLVPIPSVNSSLPDLPPKKQVLALYPGTTTFYKAEVVLPKVKRPSTTGSDAGKDGHAELKDGFVRLRFEGEEEVEREMDVERRYVLSEVGK